MTKTRPIWKTSLLILRSLSLLGASQCSTKPPAIDIELWAGDSATSSIVRKQNSASIECRDVKFDDFVCVSYDDLAKVYSTIQKCKKWEF